MSLMNEIKRKIFHHLSLVYMAIYWLTPRLFSLFFFGTLVGILGALEFIRLRRPEVNARLLDKFGGIHREKLVDDDQLIVPEGDYFVMGDNRDDSLDSRYWGFVPQENIVGRPLVIYWSMRAPDAPVGAVTTGDKLYRFLYALSHIMQITRWNRTLRLVR